MVGTFLGIIPAVRRGGRLVAVRALQGRMDEVVEVEVEKY